MHRNDESFQEVMKTTRHAPARPGVEDFGVDLKDINTGVHSTRLAEWAIRVARKMNIPEDRLYQVEIAALLHGVGIIGVPDAILKKAGPLTDEERTLINRHPEYSWSILRRFPGLEEASLLCTITKVRTAQAIPQDCKPPTSRSCQESSLSSTPTMRWFRTVATAKACPTAKRSGACFAAVGRNSIPMSFQPLFRSPNRKQQMFSKLLEPVPPQFSSAYLERFGERCALARSFQPSQRLRTLVNTRIQTVTLRFPQRETPSPFVKLPGMSRTDLRIC